MDCAIGFPSIYPLYSDLSGGKEKQTGQGTQKCHGCGRSGHFACDKVCPAKEKFCANWGKRGHWATCFRNETDGRSDGRGSERNSWQSCGAFSGRNLKPWGQQVNRADCVSEEEPFALPVNYNEERACEDNVIAVKINGTVTRMLVDSGAPSTVLGEQQFHNLERNGLKQI